MLKVQSLNLPAMSMIELCISAVNNNSMPYKSARGTISVFNATDFRANWKCHQ